MVKLTEQQDSEYISFTRNSFSDNNYGFEGIYTNKLLGQCNVYVTQDCQNNYYLMLDIWKNGREYHRQYFCSEKPSYRLAGLKAKEFLELINSTKNR